MSLVNKIINFLLVLLFIGFILLGWLSKNGFMELAIGILGLAVLFYLNRNKN